MLKSQKHLFDLPEGIAYLNTAYMSPLMNSVVEAVEEGVRLKARPWTLTIDHFFEDVHKSKRLFAKPKQELSSRRNGTLVTRPAK